ncbi:MAG: alpha/beta fold hydrolase [Acidimicrobiales bacterium]
MGVALHTETRGDHGPRLVLVHGFTQNSRCWSPIDDDLARDHRLVLVDAPGHGGSSAVRADLETGAGLLGAVGGRATYIGYSMGGRLALRLALDRPELVERLILIGASPGIEDDRERDARRRADDRLADHLESVGLAAFLDEWLAQPLFAGLDPAAAHRAARLDNTVEGLSSSLRLAGTGTQQPLWDRLAELTMPVLVVVGALDTRFHRIGERMRDAIGGNAELALIDGAGHAAHLEQPVAFAKLVRRWLTRTPITR